MAAEEKVFFFFVFGVYKQLTPPSKSPLLHRLSSIEDEHHGRRGVVCIVGLSSGTLLLLHHIPAEDGGWREIGIVEPPELKEHPLHEGSTPLIPHSAHLLHSLSMENEAILLVGFRDGSLGEWTLGPSGKFTPAKLYIPGLNGTPGPRSRKGSGWPLKFVDLGPNHPRSCLMLGNQMWIVSLDHLDLGKEIVSHSWTRIAPVLHPNSEKVSEGWMDSPSHPDLFIHSLRFLWAYGILYLGGHFCPILLYLPQTQSHFHGLCYHGKGKKFQSNHVFLLHSCPCQDQHVPSSSSCSGPCKSEGMDATLINRDEALMNYPFHLE